MLFCDISISQIGFIVRAFIFFTIFSGIEILLINDSYFFKLKLLFDWIYESVVESLILNKQ
jgi:hypothetical protein